MNEKVELVFQKDIYSLLTNAEEPLCIPEYQRGYCWGKKQVERLLESIWYYDWKDSKILHLGTIVVYEHVDKSGQNKSSWEIVDGQQRLLTLSILLAQLEKEDLPLPLLNCTTDDEDVLKHVHWAAMTIKKWVIDHGKEDAIQSRMKQTKVDIVQIHYGANLSLAYTFFNAINSAGKKLSDYDLLKSHHLRFLGTTEPQAWLAREWDACIQEKIVTFNGEEAPLVEELLDSSLYRLRRWIRNRGIRNDRGHVFEHYSSYESITRKCLSSSDSSYASGIIGGMWFFRFVRKYADIFKRFSESEAVRQLYAFNNASRHIRLLHVIRALLFLYYCKFCIDGELYLNDALMFIIQRMGRLRNKYKITESIFSESIVLHTVEALDESPTPEHFFRYCVLPTNLYVRDYGEDGEDEKYKTSSRIRPAFWQGANQLYKKLKPGMIDGWFDPKTTFVSDFSK